MLLILLYFKVMADRIRSMRASLFDNLEKLNSPLNWDHIVKQVSSEYDITILVKLHFCSSISTFRTLISY